MPHTTKAIAKHKQYFKKYLQTADGKKISEFVNVALTDSEIIAFCNRLAIMKHLKKGVSQHKIAQMLGVGVATVTAISKKIK